MSLRRRLGIRLKAAGRQQRPLPSGPEVIALT
jgi:hypothetical protein